MRYAINQFIYWNSEVITSSITQQQNRIVFKELSIRKTIFYDARRILQPDHSCANFALTNFTTAAPNQDEIIAATLLAHFPSSSTKTVLITPAPEKSRRLAAGITLITESLRHKTNGHSTKSALIRMQH